MVKLWDIPFFLPKMAKQHLNLFGVLSILMEKIVAVFMKYKLSSKKVFAKIYEKLKNLSEILEKLDEYECS